MKSSRLVLINVLVIVLIVAGGGVAVYYYMQSVNYITTNNARVDGQSVTIAAPAAGVLTHWTGQVGQAVPSGGQIGAVRTPAGPASIRSPINGTIVQQNAVVGALVALGAPLARSYNFDNLWVTANISEANIRDVKPGQAVDVDIAAFPGTTLTGKIGQIGLATAGTFSLLPAANTTTNYTNVAQVIPVTVTLDNYRGIAILPGMSASIRIHR